MSKPDTFDYKTVATVGVQATAAVASAVTAIPNCIDGHIAKYIRIQSLTAYCYIKPCLAAGAATVNDILLSPNNDIVLCVNGFTHIAALREGGADVKFNITPLEVG